MGEVGNHVAFYVEVFGTLKKKKKKGFDKVGEDLHTLLPVATPVVGRWCVPFACGIGV